METFMVILELLVNTALFLLIIITVSVGTTVNSKNLKRDSVSFLIVLTFLLFLSR